MAISILDAIRSQIEEASADLDLIAPSDMGWRRRAEATALTIVPWLQTHSIAIKAYVEGVLNAPTQLRRLWADIRPFVSLPRERIVEFDHQLALDDVLRDSVTGELISKVVTAYLLQHNQRLANNGRSDYPDIYISDIDYTGLSDFRRSTDDKTVEYGASIKNGRPVRVPDGMEIKTCKSTIRVDCHFPHVGLHFCLVYVEKDRVFSVTDLRIAFLRTADYHISGRNTGTTTVKASFNGNRFISLLSEA